MKKEDQIERIFRPDYKGFTLKQCATRPNSLNILNQPSRIDKLYFYPDGRIESVSATTTNI
jgi:hypothetical protein